MSYDQLQRLREYVKENNDRFISVGKSTHSVMAFSFEGKEYILKRQLLEEDNLSPFWKLMKWVFALDFSQQRKAMGELTAFLRERCPISVPRVVFLDEKQKMQVFEKCSGSGYEPDLFPEKVAFQLGEFLSLLHREEYSFAGTIYRHDICDLKQRMDFAAQRLIREVWGNRKELIDCLNHLKKTPFSLGPFVPIMTDISANQFLFSPSFDHLEAVVDLDAYVIGPREWELSVVKGCVEDWEAFCKGYEKNLPFPDLQESEPYYTFLMALCDPWNPSGLKHYLEIYHEGGIND